jgi:hypothetical protein
MCRHASVPRERLQSSSAPAQPALHIACADNLAGLLEERRKQIHVYVPVSNNVVYLHMTSELWIRLLTNDLYIELFAYKLFNDAVSRSDYTASNFMLISE